MGLLTGFLTLPVSAPLASVRGVVWLAEQIHDQAEREFYDPVKIRGQLHDIAEARETGQLSAEEADQLEEQLIERLFMARANALGG
jgi:hypothetical protein